MAEGLTTKNSLHDSFQIFSIYKQKCYQGGIFYHYGDEPGRIRHFDLEWKKSS